MAVYQASRQPARQPARLPASVQVSKGLGEVLASLPRLQRGATRLLLARHGESVANQNGLLCGGRTDSDLNDRGRAQAQELAHELANALVDLKLDLVGSSSLRRAVASADVVAQSFPAADRVVLGELREMDYGSLEGAPIRDVQKEMSELSNRWRSGETDLQVGGASGESPEVVARRMMTAVSRLLRERGGGTSLLVCHAHVNKALIASICPGVGLTNLHDVPQRNCAVNVLDFDCTAAPTGCEASAFKVLGIDLMAGSHGKL